MTTEVKSALEMHQAELKVLQMLSDVSQNTVLQNAVESGEIVLEYSSFHMESLVKATFGLDRRCSHFNYSKSLLLNIEQDPDLVKQELLKAYKVRIQDMLKSIEDTKSHLTSGFRSS